MATEMGDGLFMRAAVDHELEVARLYRTFAKFFPELGERWNQLAEEEEAQAEFMRNMEEERRNYTVSLAADRIPTSHLVMSINRIRSNIETMYGLGMTPEKAIELAKLVEQEDVEQDIFQAFRPTDPSIASAIHEMDASNRAQMEIIEEMASSMNRPRILSWLCFWRRNQN